jgi:hypothetical protein
VQSARICSFESLLEFALHLTTCIFLFVRLCLFSSVREPRVRVEFPGTRGGSRVGLQDGPEVSQQYGGRSL